MIQSYTTAVLNVWNVHLQHILLRLYEGTTDSPQSTVLSTCPLHTISGCGKERRIFIGPW